MSHLPIRSEKNCLNCGAHVDDRFCTKCGQENVINRPSFHHLFTHFFADLFHYDSGFWKTIKTLLFQPGKIVKEFLQGKRKSYVEPVKLYIFVSFIAFFLPVLLPDFSEKSQEKTEEIEVKKPVEEFEGIEVAGYDHIKTVEQLDSIQNTLPDSAKISPTEYAIFKNTLELINETDSLENDEIDLNFENFDDVKVFNKSGVDLNEDYKNIKSVHEFDSIHTSLPSNKKMNWIFAKFGRKTVELQEKELDGQKKFVSAFKDAFVGNLPKALFIYLPFFAFSLWLVHGKRKWKYYDHGIFTLYFFSALLIMITLLSIASSILKLPFLWTNQLEDLTYILATLLAFGLIFYSIFYFFRAHHRVYQESAWISRLKCIVLLIVNALLLFFVLLGYTLITFMMI